MLGIKEITWSLKLRCQSFFQTFSIPNILGVPASSILKILYQKSLFNQVFGAFNLDKVINFITQVRESLDLDIPLFFYVHLHTV